MHTDESIVGDAIVGGLRITESGCLEIWHEDDQIGVELTPESARHLSRILLVLADMQEGKISVADFRSYLGSQAGGVHA